MHIDQETLIKFHNGTLDTQEMMQVLSHLGTCEYCCGQLAALEESDSLIKAPSYLKGQIQNRTHMLDVQTAVQVKKTTKQMQLFYYSMKTAAGVVGALLLLLAVARVDMPLPMPNEGSTSISSEVTGKIYDGSNQLTGWLNQFTNKLIYGGKKQ